MSQLLPHIIGQLAQNVDTQAPTLFMWAEGRVSNMHARMNVTCWKTIRRSLCACMHSREVGTRVNACMHNGVLHVHARCESVKGLQHTQRKSVLVCGS